MNYCSGTAEHAPGVTITAQAYWSPPNYPVGWFITHNNTTVSDIYQCGSPLTAMPQSTANNPYNVFLDANNRWRIYN